MRAVSQSELVSNKGVFANESEALSEIVQRLVARLDPASIWLFGSRARGTARPDSDFDLLLVAKRSGASIRPTTTTSIGRSSGSASDVISCRVRPKTLKKQPKSRLHWSIEFSPKEGGFMTRKRIETFLQIADEEYAAACKLQLLLPRQGAYFLQQSVEKLIRPRGPLVAEFSHASRKGQSVECFGGASSATENL